jgi:hypothetical protein
MPWQLAGISIQGAAHLRRGQANQDAHLCRHDLDSGTSIIAVADGHGSAPYTRSDVGARLAVTAAADALAACLARTGPLAAAIEALPFDLVQRWRLAVDDHLAQCPPTPDTASATTQPRQGPFLRYLAYGTTVIALGLRGEDLLVMQTGDGQAMLVGGNAPPWNLLPEDLRLGAGPTTSLCTPDAVRHVRVAAWRLADIAADAPALLLLTTDGWHNCFMQDSDFRAALRALRDLVAQHGLPPIATRLAPWLSRCSARGSGDDCTLALAWAGDLPAEPGTHATHQRIDHRLAELGHVLSDARRRLRAGLGLVLTALLLIAAAAVARRAGWG